MASSSGSTVLMLGVAGVAAYYAYSQGWLSSLFGSTATAAATPVTTVSTPVAAPVAAPVVYTPQVQVTVPYTPAPSSVIKPIPNGVVANGPLATAIAQSMANSGATAAQINTAIAQAIQGTAGLPPGASLAGVGAYRVIGPRRTAIVFPRRHVAVVLPRNYHVRGRV